VINRGKIFRKKKGIECSAEDCSTKIL